MGILFVEATTARSLATTTTRRMTAVNNQMEVEVAGVLLISEVVGIVLVEVVGIPRMEVDLLVASVGGVLGLGLDPVPGGLMVAARKLGPGAAVGTTAETASSHRIEYAAIYSVN